MCFQVNVHVYIAIGNNRTYASDNHTWNCRLKSRSSLEQIMKANHMFQQVADIYFTLITFFITKCDKHEVNICNLLEHLICLQRALPCKVPLHHKASPMLEVQTILQVSQRNWYFTSWSQQSVGRWTPCFTKGLHDIINPIICEEGNINWIINVGPSKLIRKATKVILTLR